MDITLIAVHPVGEIFGVENIQGGKTAKVPLLRKILKAGEGYERPDRDATVTATYTVKHSSSGATICTHASRTWTTDEDQARRGRDTTELCPWLTVAIPPVDARRPVVGGVVKRCKVFRCF